MSDTEAPVRNVELGPLDLVLEQREDGTILGHASEEEQSYSDNILQWLRYWGGAEPGHIFLAERPAPGAPGWNNITYAETYEKMRSIALALLNRNVSPERPVAVLSGNSIDHALVALAAMYIGVPYAPVSPAYSLISKDFAKLKHVLGLLTPGVIYVGDGVKFSGAIAAAVPPDVELIVSQNPPPGRAATLFAPLLAPIEEDADVVKLNKAHEAVEPETVAKILFTSGSTGLPKGVINTQKMLCANQAMIEYFMPFLIEEPPVLVDWLPWHHTFGGNQNLGLVLRHGGTMYIDHGNPLPAGINESVRNLREVAPTLYFNVPRGFHALLPYLQQDKELAKNFFGSLSFSFVASAGMSQEVFDGLDAASVEACGERIMVLSGYGATETAPAALFSLAGRSGGIGLPLPGVLMKLMPNEGKLEVRLKGPNVSPGYWREPELTAKSFDAEGYYITGDALRFADPEKPEEGFVYDGRVVEDFKLSTGNWVSTGPLRAAFVAAFAPYVRDAAVAGHDQDEIGMLVFPDVEACRALAPDLAKDASVAAVLAHQDVRMAFQTRLACLDEQATGSTNRVARLLLLEEPPSIDAHEITDKGTLNQRAVLENRAAAVAELYKSPSSEHIVLLSS
ncbi:feruloyl-CoA synthase [Methyloferula stellata]|uniref:feruloyl-CoA synthase n=1 Tax=Methyloferula stellata TaxID=876270 RepID=UPI000378F2F4|nr:feruloyl-CoA synthase [Methyloferula stellata]